MHSALDSVTGRAFPWEEPSLADCVSVLGHVYACTRLCNMCNFIGSEVGYVSVCVCVCICVRTSSLGRAQPGSIPWWPYCHMLPLGSSDIRLYMQHPKTHWANMILYWVNSRPSRNKKKKTDKSVFINIKADTRWCHCARVRVLPADGVLVEKWKSS